MSIDPSFRNTGLAYATYQFDNQTLSVDDIELIQTEADASKQVRRNSDDLRCAVTLIEELHDRVRSFKPALIFAEIPSGTQSARASWTLGITVGVLASLELFKTPLVQVLPQPVKVHFAGSKTASKRTMIDTAVERHPHLSWLRHNGKVTNTNEHLADAIAILEYGVTLPEAHGYFEILKRVKEAA